MAIFNAPSEGGSLSERIALMNAKRGAKTPSQLATQPEVPAATEDNQSNRVAVNAVVTQAEKGEMPKIPMPRTQEEVPEVGTVDAIAELAKLVQEQTKELKKINKHLNSLVKTIGK